MRISWIPTLWTPTLPAYPEGRSPSRISMMCCMAVQVGLLQAETFQCRPMAMVSASGSGCGLLCQDLQSQCIRTACCCDTLSAPRPPPPPPPPPPTHSHTRSPQATVGRAFAEQGTVHMGTARVVSDLMPALDACTVQAVSPLPRA